MTHTPQLSIRPRAGGKASSSAAAALNCTRTGPPPPPPGSNYYEIGDGNRVLYRIEASSFAAGAAIMSDGLAELCYAECGWVNGKAVAHIKRDVHAPRRGLPTCPLTAHADDAEHPTTHRKPQHGWVRPRVSLLLLDFDDQQVLLLPAPRDDLRPHVHGRTLVG